MRNVKIELNSDGIRQLLQSQELGDVVDAAAEKMTAAAGVRYVSNVRISGDRISAMGRGESKHAGTGNS